MSDAPTVTAVEFKTPEIIPGFPGQTEAHATLSDGTEKVVLKYFSDELTFTDSDLIGKTEQEIAKLFHDRDVAYLQSP